MYFRGCCFLLIWITSKIGVHSISLQLTPSQVHVIENSSATLTCSKTNGALSESRWNNSLIVGDANLFISNGQCIVTRFLNNSGLFIGLCNGNGTYSVIIKKIDRTQHGVLWQCQEFYPTISNPSMIIVLVPASSTTLSHHNGDNLMENQTEKITCLTSACRPDPRVQWYLRDNHGGVVYNMTQFSTYKYVERENSLKAVESILDFKPNRTVNAYHLYCEVWTQSDRADVKSREFIVNVTYPPDNNPKIHDINNNQVLRIIESDTGTFVCSVTGGNPLASLSWNCFGSNEEKSETHGNKVTSTLEWTAVRNFNTCSCLANHISRWEKETTVSVNVQYNPGKPRLTVKETTIISGDVRIIRNNTFKVVCKSDSNPPSNYTWTGPGILSKGGYTLEIANIRNSSQGEYKCSASNRMIRTDNSYIDGINASTMNLIMLYPPSAPKLRFGEMVGQIISSNIFNVIKGDTFTMYCEVDGNPTPNVTWGNNKIDPVLRVSNAVTDTKRSCTATNVMKETGNPKEIYSMSNASLSINVLYPPGVPTINVSNYNGNNIPVHTEYVSIIESEAIDVTCFSMSKPLPSYKWVHERSLKTYPSNILQFKNITRNANGTYTCNVENIMNRSIGKTETGKNLSKIILDILFPASVDVIEDRSVLVGSEFKRSCPVLNGNPSFSTIEWSRLSDEKKWQNKLLHIRNISRTDDSDYTCSVITEMYPAIGSDLKIKMKQSFHLNVFFPSEIRHFMVPALGTEGNSVINETDYASFECTAEANPPSNLTIKNPAGDEIAKVLRSNIARYTLRNATYIHAGEYTCSGRNNYTSGLPSSSSLILIVKCAPRPSSGDTSVKKVATVLLVNITLEFSAWNYLDEPTKTVFSWFKENVSMSDNGSKYIIRTDGLKTNFTIMNTTQHDLGLYHVNANNSIGGYTHYYDLSATDKPDPPTDFHVINESITDTSVTLTWSVGFNGGFQQDFVILYKIKFESNWLNKSIHDNGNKLMNFTLNDLTSLQEYEIEMFAKNRKGNSLHTERIQFKTKASLKMPGVSPPANLSGIIAGSVSAVAVLLVVIGLVLFFRKRQNRKNDGIYQNIPFFGKKKCQEPTKDIGLKQKTVYSSQTEEKTFKGKTSIQGKQKLHYEEKRTTTKIMGSNSKTVEKDVEGLQEIDDVPNIMHERTEYCNSKDEIDKIKRITIAELYVYVFGNEDDLEIEYQKLPTGLQKPCTFARKPENIVLNRYNGIYPYDHSRVKISEHPDFFINACYIDGYKRKKAYIASLGPTSKTTSDFKTFWQMIWHERSDLIVMLTNLNEVSGMKCEKYWPDGGTELQYGGVLVTSKTTEVYAEYTVRTFEITKGNHKRPLTHLHYTAWPDKTVPEDATSLLEFRRRMKDLPSNNNGPAVVHCSAGIGRTGTLIALDILIEEGLDIGSVNVFECVNILRDQRVKMVQTLEQYVYIHKALVNALSFECETFTRKKILEYLKTENDRQYSTLFQQLKLSVETDNTKEQKERTRNSTYSNKNRQGADIPGDRYRFYLHLTDGRREGADYINAVYCNSFKRKDHFITAQSPLTTTLTDFISMIYHGDCSCIATMEDLKEPGMAVGAYIAEKNGAIIVGNYEVTCSKFEENSNSVIRKMKIKNTGEIGSGEKCFYHFQYRNWMTGDKTPGDVADFVQFVQEVEEYANELGEDRSRVVVHCLKANERSCLFCAVAIIMEKLKFEGSVNISNVVRHLRTRRRSAIVSKEQLKFCYEAASAFVKKNKR